MLELSEIIEHAVILHNAKRSLKKLQEMKSKKKMKGISGNATQEFLQELIRVHESWFRSNNIAPDKTNVLKIHKEVCSED